LQIMIRSSIRFERVTEYLVLVAFLFASYVSVAQFAGYSYLSWSAFRSAYFAFPFLLFSIFLSVYAHSWLFIREAWKKRSWRWASWLAGTGYVLFYVFATNAVGIPDVGVTIPPELAGGYMLPFAAYGPMTVWPDVEFYSPIMNLVGYLSVGNVLLFASFGFLTAFATALLMRNFALRKMSRRALTPFGGAVLASLSTNACCCCSPVLYPVVAIFFGGAVPGAIAESLVNPESPISNLFVLATLACLVVSLILLTRQCRERAKSD